MRYLKVSIFIGLVVSLLLTALQQTGAFLQWDFLLCEFFGTPPAEPGSQQLLQQALPGLLAFGIAWLTIDVERRSLKLILVGGTLIQLLTATALLHLYGIPFSPFLSLTAILASFAPAFIYSQSEPGQRKNLVRTVFGDRISKRTFDTLMNSRQPLNFSGERRQASIIVCELFNHESLIDALPVADYVALNNAFLRSAADFLVENGGYLDECDGASLRVIFGAPAPDENHALQACRSALALVERLQEVNAECHQLWKQRFDFRIGVNSGEIVLAAYGSGRLGSFSVAGEPAEFARRLCAANPIYGSRLLVGASTFALAEAGLEVRPMELVQRRPNEAHREEVYELLSLSNGLSDESRKRRDLFWKGLVYYREQKWKPALEALEKARPAEGTDEPLEFYLQRIASQRAGSLEIASF